MGEYSNEKAFLFEENSQLAVDPDKDFESEELKVNDEKLALSGSPDVNPFSSYLSKEDAKIVEKITNYSLEEVKALEAAELSENARLTENAKPSETAWVTETSKASETVKASEPANSENKTANNELNTNQKVESDSKKVYGKGLIAACTAVLALSAAAGGAAVITKRASAKKEEEKQND